MNTSVEAVDLLTNKMKVLEDKLAKNEADMNGVTKSSSTLGNRVDKLNKQMKDVLKRVQKLEKWQDLDNYGREKDDEYGLRKKIEFTCQESENCVSVQEDIVDLGRFEVKSRTSKGQEVEESLREALSK